MRLTDPLWIDKWSKTTFAPRPRDFSTAVRRQARRKQLGSFGTDQEPASSLWLASLSEALGDGFREGMRILDYGCGKRTLQEACGRYRR